MFSGSPLYSFANDIAVFMKNQHPWYYDSRGLIRDIAGSDKIPQIIGLNMVNDLWLMVNTPEASQEAYVDRNRTHSKHDSFTNVMHCSEFLKWNLFLTCVEITAP